MTRQSYQRGYVSEPIRTRSGIAFRIRYRVRTLDGQWIHKSETLYGLSGRKAARQKLGERIEAASQIVAEVNELTVRDFTQAYWEPYLHRRNIKPSTLATYRSALEFHILPVFGASLLNEVTPLQVEHFVQSVLKAGLSPKTARNLLGMVQGIFSVAVDHDLVAKSPVRNRHKPIARRVEKTVWSPSVVRRILENTPAPYRVFFQVLALTGVRAGEAFGLQWKHVDLANSQLRIEQSLWHGQLVTPKTNQSVRTIPLSPVLVEALTKYRDVSAMKAPDAFVFCKNDGSPLCPDVLRKDVLYSVLDRLNVPRFSGGSGFHAFRHAVASFINAETGNLKLAQKMLGHSTVNLTADVYTHVLQDSEREAARVVERAIYGESVP